MARNPVIDMSSSRDDRRNDRAYSRAVYVISVAAELAGMHPQTLRIYERKGLLEPTRTGGGSRRYTPGDIERLLRIAELTNAGLNLEGVRRVMELEDQVESLRAELARTKVALSQAVEETRREYRRELVPVSNLPATVGLRHFSGGR
jgi:MerR family transcriptional regulator, heat shock protein HspR